MTEQFKQILDGINPEILENPDTDLVEDGILDSLTIMEIIEELENAYEVDFDPDDVSPENFASAEAIWNVLQKYLREKAGEA